MQNSRADSALFNEEKDPKNSAFEGANPLPKSRSIGANRPISPPLTTSTLQNARAVQSSGSRAQLRAVEAAPRSNRLEPRGTAIACDIVEQCIGDWLADGEYESNSPATLRSKQEHVEKFVWFLHEHKITQVRSAEVKRFLAHVKNGHLEPKGRFGLSSERSFRPVTDRTVQLYFVNIRGYFAFLTAEGYCAQSPLLGVKQPKAPKPRIEPLSVEEIATLIQATKSAFTHNRERNEAILYFLFDTGVRVAEMCSLRVEDCDLARRIATVTGKGNKTRQVAFGGDTARLIKRYLEKYPRAADQELFGSERPVCEGDGITPSGVSDMLKRLAEFARINPKRVSPHKFRHSFATEFIRDGGPPKALQMLLGHEDMSMTYRYVTLSETDATAQHRKHSPAKLLRVKHRS
ncbi:tyrosine recombinase XerD [Abditibacteriota bacterium]|nr:tyrosine recombinase XerD [Abditibacteriota bacterium]